MAQREQLAVSYAAFVLSAQGAAITAESINAVLTAAHVTVNPTLVSAVAKALTGRNITEFFGSVGGGSSSAPAPAADKPTTKQAAKPAEKPAAKPKQQPKPAEEEEMDMGGLFD